MKIKTNTVNKKGVYFLYYKGEVVYIGETKMFLHRIATHLKDNIKQFDSFELVYENNTQAGRRKVEKELILKHKPKYNKDYLQPPIFLNKKTYTIYDIKKQIKIQGDSDEILKVTKTKSMSWHNTMNNGRYVLLEILTEKHISMWKTIVDTETGEIGRYTQGRFAKEINVHSNSLYKFFNGHNKKGKFHNRYMILE
jgi:predicted GIY-YIG superfamily endonuclease